ncbi:MAG: antibiotic biosynthesis monooxygenase [Candidatus Lokiarchaeota archaeon]|nr:antibiotic biosynthesis monooxygenase [Candidatus Lokiarchaeota archaeon]
MITIIATLQVKPGKMVEAIEVLKEMAANIKSSEPGTLQYIPHTVKGEGLENTIIFYEKYENEEAFQVHSKNLRITAANLAPLLAPGRDIKSCFEIK